MALSEEAQQQKDRAIAAETLRFLQSQILLATQLTEALSKVDQTLAYWQGRDYQALLTEEDLLEVPFTLEELQGYIADLVALKTAAIEQGWILSVNPIAKSGWVG